LGANPDLLSPMRQRVRISPSMSSVRGSLPILFFGDAFHARVATVGLNPSRYEYLNETGQVLSGQCRRFDSLFSLCAGSREEISDSQADQAIDMMRSYFDKGKPVYGMYFKHLTNFLKGIGTSYQERCATHLDLVQEATDPIWAHLSPQERATLLERDLPFMVWELESLPFLKAIFCAGKTVSEMLKASIRVEVGDTGSMKRIRWWLGSAVVGNRNLAIGGWNYPLDRPTGLGTTGELELGKMFAEELL
jgi:hypothetical protein